MVRLLRPEDAEPYVALRRAMLLDTPWAFSSSPVSDRASDAEFVAASLAREGYAIAGAWVVVGAGLQAGNPAPVPLAEPVAREQLVAVAAVNREQQPKRAHIAWIVGVYTRPEYRGRGLGRAVVAGAIAAARTWTGVACVQLGVSEAAPAARALYESLGFVAWGVEPDAVRVDGRAYAETHMRLGL